MCACLTAVFTFIVKACIGVGGQDHVTSTIECAVVGVGGHIIKKGGHSNFSGLCSGCLLNSNGINSNQQFIVDRSTVEKEGANYFLN